MWAKAIKIFIFGFSGVFIAMSILVIFVQLLGKIVNLFKVFKVTKDQ